MVLDDHGRPVVRWDFDDPVDARLAVRAHVELAALHQAAGAHEIFTLPPAPAPLAPGRGLRRLPRANSRTPPYGALDVACFTAHQMGSCRMGSDPGTRSPTGAASCTT